MRLFFAVILIGLLAGCNFFRPYKIDIDQGNKINQQMVDKLKVGMSKSEVRYVLGTPLLQEPFYRDRWDYINYSKPGKTQKVSLQVLTLTFDNGQLVDVSGDYNLPGFDKFIIPEKPGFRDADKPAEE